jgi:hypothetical protein
MAEAEQRQRRRLSGDGAALAGGGAEDAYGVSAVFYN